MSKNLLNNNVPMNWNCPQILILFSVFFSKSSHFLKNVTLRNFYALFLEDLTKYTIDVLKLVPDVFQHDVKLRSAYADAMVIIYLPQNFHVRPFCILLISGPFTLIEMRTLT